MSCTSLVPKAARLSRQLDGKLIACVQSKGLGNLGFEWPMGLCQDASKNIYVADHRNKRVQVLGPDLTFGKEFKCQNEVWGVAVDSFGKIHAATEAGMEIVQDELQYGNREKCGDVAISRDNCTFVTYCTPNGRLEIRKPDHSLLATISGLMMPLGVCLDGSGCIYLAEWDTLKVHKFAL